MKMENKEIPHLPKFNKLLNFLYKIYPLVPPDYIEEYLKSIGCNSEMIKRFFTMASELKYLNAI